MERERPRARCGWSEGISSYLFLPVLMGPLCLLARADALPQPTDRGDVVLLTQSPKTTEVDAFRSSTHRTPPRAGSRIVKLDASRVGLPPQILTKGFESAGRARLSFDASRFLFVGRKSALDPFGVWEVMLDATQPREVARCLGDCIQAEYVGSLYSLDQEPAQRIAYVCMPSEGGGPSIFTCNLDGTGISQTTYSPLGASELSTLRDGRLLFHMPVASNPSNQKINGYGGAWLTVNIDGTDLRKFERGLSAESRRMGLGGIDAVPMAPDIGAGGRNVERGSDDRLFISRRSQETQTLALFALEKKNSIPELFYDDAEWDEMDPVPIKPHDEPAGFASVVRGASNQTQIYCLNAYLSDSPAPPRSIRSVRVLKATGLSSSAATDGTAGRQIIEATLGEARVESDGSFYVEAPPGVPIRFETVGEDGLVVESMKTWIWVMPGEHRGCIGCHEDRSLTPPNRHALALRRPPEKLVFPERSRMELDPQQPVPGDRR